MKTISCLCMAFFLALLGTTVQAQSGYNLYDDFSSKMIDPDKWFGAESWNHGFKLLECARNIQSGGMHMLNYFYGDTSYDEGSLWGANRLAFPDSSGVTGIKGTITVKAYALKGCSSNDSQAQVRARIVGTWFNTGVPTPGSDEGDVTASIYVRRLSGSTAKAAVFEVFALVSHCYNSDCSDYALLGYYGKNVLGTVNKGKKVTLRVEWDQANHRFIFQRDTNAEVYIYYKDSENWDPSWDDTSEPGASYGGYKRLETRGDMPNCTTEPRPMGFIEANFYDIYVK